MEKVSETLVGMDEEHPANNFPLYMSKVATHLDKVRKQFEFAATYCGHKNDASMCRHARQMFVKPCALEVCPLLRTSV